MAYRIKNEATKALGWEHFKTVKEAKAAAKASSKFHGVKVSVVDQEGRALPKQTRAKKNAGLENLQMAVNMWNFGRTAR